MPLAATLKVAVAPAMTVWLTGWIVMTGATFQGETVILNGIQAGERVVTDGQMRLTPGAMVAVK